MQSEPPKKKRRLAAPDFELSFGLPSRETKLVRKSLKASTSTINRFNAFEENDSAAEQLYVNSTTRHVATPVKTPRRIIKPELEFSPQTSSSPSMVHAQANRAKHIPHVQAVFSEFSSMFGIEKKGLRRRDGGTNNLKAPADISAGIRDVGRVSTSSPVSRSRNGTTANISKTPLRVLAPPHLKEPDPRSHALLTSPLFRISKSDAENASCLPLKLELNPNSSDRTPKKVLGSLSSNIVNIDNDETPITPSNISYIDRAERIAQSIHKATETNIPDLIRGMDVSPEKSNTGRRKLVRGGLAEHAQRLLSKNSMDIALWEAERNKGRSRVSKSDLDLRILSILSTTYHPTTIYPPSASNDPRAILAKCLFLRGQSIVTSTSNPRLIVFLVPSNKSMVGFEVGKEVRVWRPWHEISIPKSDEGTSESDTAESSRAALLCSRFDFS